MTPEEIKEKKELFLGSVTDMVANLCYYDRKNDNELSASDVDELIDGGHVSLTEIFDILRKEFNENYEIKQ